MDNSTKIYPDLNQTQTKIGFEDLVNTNCRNENPTEHPTCPSDKLPKMAEYPKTEAPKLDGYPTDNHSPSFNHPPSTILDQESGEEEEANSNSYLKYLISIISIVVLIISVLLFKFNPNQREKKVEFKPLESKFLIKNLKNDFKNQHVNFYSNIVSCYENSILNNKDPSIVMLVSDKNSKQNLDCVGKKLLKMLNEIIHGDSNYKNLVINTRLLDRDPDTAKLQLDSNLTNIFNQLNKRTVLVEDISNIPPKAMMIFYAYGDEYSNSRYNGIMVLLSYALDVGLSGDKFKLLSNDYSLLSTLVEEKLTADWSNEIYYDQLKPLFTRIANNIVLVDRESNC